MSHTLELFIPGHPQPQGSKRHVGGGRMIESAKDLQPWRDRIAYTCLAERNRCKLAPFTGAVHVGLVFILRRPKATPKTRTPPAIKKPDVDKLGRAVLDAITGVLVIDDSQVTRLTLSKRLAELTETPGLNMRIEGVTI